MGDENSESVILIKPLITPPIHPNNDLILSLFTSKEIYKPQIICEYQYLEIYQQFGNYLDPLYYVYSLYSWVNAYIKCKDKEEVKHYNYPKSFCHHLYL